MSRLPYLRVIIDPEPKSGSWNMAVDEALLISAIELGIATLRWYRWSEPTVSLGYFQRDEELAKDHRLADLPRVRRLSGGGALVHDRELTYSLSLPTTASIVHRPVELYNLVHQAFIGEFRQRGLEVHLRGSTDRRAPEPVLCFARADENDLVFRDHKVLGSAQRRRRGCLLQHGGCLLQASSVTPELPGIIDLAPNGDFQNLEMTISSILVAQIADGIVVNSLTTQELETALRIAEGR